MINKKRSWLHVLIILLSFLGFWWGIRFLQQFNLLPQITKENYVMYQVILEILLLLGLIVLNRLVIHQKVSFAQQIANPVVSLIPIIFLLLILMSFLSLRNSALIQQTYPQTLPLALFAGICEEYLCRGLLFPQVLKGLAVSETKLTCKQVDGALIGSALIFGGLHLFNLTMQNWCTTLMQIWLACCAGLFLGSLYVSSHSIFVPMLFHFLYDFLVMYSRGPIQQAVAWNPQTQQSLLFFTVIYLGYSYLLIRKKRLEKQLFWLADLTNLPA